MSDAKRWTVRNVSPETIEIIGVMRAFSGRTAGDLLNEAIDDWYENLEEVDEHLIEDANEEEEDDGGNG